MEGWLDGVKEKGVDTMGIYQGNGVKVDEGKETMEKGGNEGSVNE